MGIQSERFVTKRYFGVTMSALQAVSICIVLISSIIHIGAIIARRKHWPVRNRGWELSIAAIITSSSFSVMGLYAYHDEWGQSANCILYSAAFWTSAIYFNSAVYIRHLYLYLNFGFNDRISKESNENHDQLQAMHSKLRRRFMMFLLKKRRNLLALLYIYGLICGIPQWIFLSTHLEMFQYSLSDIQCNWVGAVNANIVVFSLGVLMDCVIAWKLRNRQDNLGIMKELFTMDAVLLSWLIISVVVSNNVISDGLEIQSLMVFLFPAVGVTYSVGSRVLYDSYYSRTSPFKADNENDGEELLQLLNDENGRRQFMKFLLGEFSAESIYFYEAVEYYRIDVSTRQALQIYDNFVTENSQYCINVSHNARTAVRDRIEADQIDETLFDGCRREILDLLRYDPFRRFKLTKVYKSLENDDSEEIFVM